MGKRNGVRWCFQIFGRLQIPLTPALSPFGGEREKNLERFRSFLRAPQREAINHLSAEALAKADQLSTTNLLNG